MTTDPHHATSADGTRIAWSAAGDGPLLVLVDGALCQRAMGPSEGLTAALSDRFTVVCYDRRGRGGSGPGATPFAPQREIEDLAAVIEAAGGDAYVFGSSSGGTLALEAARAGVPMTALAVYESPAIVDDTREPIEPTLNAEVAAMIERGERGKAVSAFMRFVGTPGFAIVMMRLMPVWRKLTGVAHTLPHDFTLMAPQQQGRPWPAGYYDSVTCRTVVYDGAKSPDWLRNTAALLGSVLPDARHVSLPGQTHMIKPKVLAPVLTTDLLGS